MGMPLRAPATAAVFPRSPAGAAGRPLERAGQAWPARSRGRPAAPAGERGNTAAVAGARRGMPMLAFPRRALGATLVVAALFAGATAYASADGPARHGHVQEIHLSESSATPALT